jgi:hypothetical protein
LSKREKVEFILSFYYVLQQPQATEAEKAEREARLKPKPKPKFDKKTGKWVVMSWDGSVAGVENVEKGAASSEEPISMNLMLYPRPWEGFGMLGCHIVKYTLE